MIDHTYTLVAKAAHESHLKGEKDDCLVRALVVVTGMSYEDSYALCELAGRPPRKPWYVKSVVFAANTLGINFKKITLDRRMSASTFARMNPKGRFYVTMKGHCFAIVDGKVCNTHSDRVFVTSAYQYEV